MEADGVRWYEGEQPDKPMNDASDSEKSSAFYHEGKQAGITEIR
jgi:hypothetical protein